jgi:hypothetical protein
MQIGLAAAFRLFVASEERNMSESAELIDIASEFRVPRNMAAEIKGSIHDDATASRLGFRGGTVAGSIHMDQFPPLLIQLFGDDFFQRGNLSLYFKHATVDQEPVRAFARREPGQAQARLTMENEAGDQVLEGTAACGAPDLKSELRRRLAGQAVVTDGLKILGQVRPGPMGEPVPVRLDREMLDKRTLTITEPLPAYRGEGRWPGAVLPPSVAVQLCMNIQRQRLRTEGPAVGLFGAIELQFLDGPVLADTEYLSRGEILALSESPKTENVWYQSTLADPQTGKDVAWMIQYLRFMKASSPLYAA